MSRFLDPRLEKLEPYVPGEQPRNIRRLVKLNTNENPYPPSPGVRQVLADLDPADLRLYPHPDAGELRQAAARLSEEVERLRPDAEAYAQFRERIGAIECEARKRAADLEAASQAQMRRTVETFRAQYQALMHTFNSTAAHVTGELRKVEVNLTQLPRAMDQAGVELKELEKLLEQNSGQNG